jgi:hypothetical protein
MNNKTRADVVRAMNTMVSCINYESIIDTWLALGVADGDIKADTTNEEIEELGYTDDKTFSELMTLFLKLMSRAGNDGGLFCDGIVSGHKVISWTEGL